MADGRISQLQLPNGNIYSIRAGAIPYGEVDSSSTSTAFTATVPGINELKNGTIMLLRNGDVTSASGFTININGLGAKPVYNNLATGNTHTPTNPTRDTTIFNINYTMLFIYDEDLVSGGAWICYRGYDANTNTIGYQLRGNNGTRPAADTGYRYRLWLSSLDNQSWVPINTSTATNATTARSLNSRVIDPFGEIIYDSHNGTTNAAANLSATTIWQQYTLTIGYSYVKSLTTGDPVYLKCEPQTSGGAVMKDIVQALPSTADGFIYIYLGIAYSATAMELRFYHPVYYHDGTGIRAWTGTQIPTKTSELTNDSGFITIDDVPEGAVPTTTTPLMDGTAAVGTETKYAKGDHVHPTDTSRVPITRTINGKALSSDITINATEITGYTDSQTHQDVSVSSWMQNLEHDIYQVGQDKVDDVKLDGTSIVDSNRVANISSQDILAGMQLYARDVSFQAPVQTSYLGSASDVEEALLALDTATASKLELFKVTLSYSNNTYTIDKTVAQVEAAIFANKYVYLYDGTGTVGNAEIIIGTLTEASPQGAGAIEFWAESSGPTYGEPLYIHYIIAEDTGEVDVRTEFRGTVTRVAISNSTNGGLSVSGSPITSSGTITVGHSNILDSAQETRAVYPIAIDKNGHITDYGSAVTSMPASDVSSWAKASTKPSYTFSEIGSTPTTISGYGITDAYTKTQVDGLVAGVLHYKGTKASVANLPTSGNTTGDVWHITADGSEYAWDGSVWQELGTAVDLSNYVTHGNTGSSTTGITISDHSTTSIYGVSSSTTSVTGVQPSTTTASKVTIGSSTTDYGVKTTNTPTVIDTTKFNGGSYSHTGFSGGSFTRGSFSGGSLTMTMDTTDTKKLNITFTAATHGNDSFTAASYGTDSFTAASLGSGFYTAGTAATLGSKVPTVSANDVTVPIKATSATTVPIKNSSSTTVVTSGTHSITDPGHTHTI